MSTEDAGGQRRRRRSSRRATSSLPPDGQGDASSSLDAAAAAAAAPVDVAGGIEAEAASADSPDACLLAMDALMDKLLVLGYDAAYVRALRKPPVSRCYFALSEGNAALQLYSFASLLAWLLRLAGAKGASSFDAPESETEDPNLVVTNIMRQLKTSGLPCDFAPTRIKAGSGPEVLDILNRLADRALAKCGKNKLLKPEFPPEQNQAAMGLDDNDDDEANNMEMSMDAGLGEDDEIEEDFFDGGDAAFIDPLESINRGQDGGADGAGMGESSGGAKASEILASNTDTSEWRLEVERVLPRLKVQIRQDQKDWRHHYSQMKSHRTGMQDTLEKARTPLDQLHSDVGRTLEKIAAREKYINSQMENLVLEYRTQQNQAAQVQERFQRSGSGVNDKTSRLAQLTEELDIVKSQMDERGSTMTDQSPVVKLKQTLNGLKKETGHMELRIGVLEHTLLSYKVQHKSHMVREMGLDDHNRSTLF